MQFLKSSIGRKVLMAITGFFMFLFAITHLLGNSSIFGWLPGGINAYAHHLHSMPAPVIWGFRIALLVLISVHAWYSIQLTIENREARSQQYAVKTAQKASFASENMIWTGLIILAFILYHLAHFTLQVVSPETAALSNLDAQGNPNVFGMVVSAFQNIGVTLIYAVAMAGLFLHLYHGVQSSFQTVGWNNDRTMPAISSAGKLVALVLFVGYLAIPLTILVRILK